MQPITPPGEEDSSEFIGYMKNQTAAIASNAIIIGQLLAVWDTRASFNLPQSSLRSRQKQSQSMCILIFPRGACPQTRLDCDALHTHLASV